jgi:AcrR family transcriptional regulator
VEEPPPLSASLAGVSALDRPLRRDASRNRERVLEAARDLFAERGLEVTLDDVAHHAGVGVGTVYRRFPDKEQLIEALFEERLAAVAGLAEQALGTEDAWEGLVGFLEATMGLQAADRGLKEIILGGPHGREHVIAARRRIAPIVARLVARAQKQGALRPDLRVTDMPLLQLMVGAIIDVSRDVEPELWRRFLGLLLDGLRARRDEAHPLPSEALSIDQLATAMSAWRPPRA